MGNIENTEAAESKDALENKEAAGKKKGKKGKKKIFRKILLGIVGVLLVLLGFDICKTEIYASKIPHRFASAAEGKEILVAQTDYFDALTRDDIEYRMQKDGATLENLLVATTSEIKDFTLFDKYLIDRRIAKMERTIKKNGYTLPAFDEIVYIKTDMNLEQGVCRGATGYTHSNQIYLSSTSILLSWIPEADEYFDMLLWHELFHCLTRNNPEFRKEMYSLIHFTVADKDFEIPPSVAEKYINNPDVEHHDAYATFNIDGKDIDCFTVWIKPNHFADAKTEEEADDKTALVPIDGTDTYYIMDDKVNYKDVFGTNTDYDIDPEECMADNFKYAMYYGIEGKDGQGYSDPDIIRGIIDIVSR